MVALGFSIAINAGRTFHLAHGAVFAVAGMLSYQLATAWAWPPPMSLAGAVGAGIVITLLIDRFVYAGVRARRGAAVETIIVASLGADAVLRGLMALAWGSEARSMPIGMLSGIQVRDATLSGAQLCQVAAFTGILIMGTAFLPTRLGRIARALADDPELLGVLGYNAGVLRAIAMAVAGALAGCAGFLAVADVGIDARSGLDAVLIAAVTTSLSGSKWIIGPLAAALLLGQVQAWTGCLVSSKWSPVVVFTVLTVLLMLRPRGLLVASVRPDAI
jgi:branched-subunit amino acid ABC-type transport system permease component